LDEEMGNVAVLCTRVRVEEKQLLAAFAHAGVPAEPMSPEPAPFPMPRASLATPAGLSNISSPLDAARRYSVVIDRMHNRTVASALMRNHRATGSLTIDAGLAAVGTRLDVMHALAAEGLPLPPALLALSEQAGLEAIERTGYPATVFPMQIGLSGIGLQDREIAEAVLEHRHTLGGSAESVMVVQGGLHDESDLIKAIVVDGTVVAYEGTCHHPNGFAGCEQLAVAAAAAIGASLVGVTLAHTPEGLVIWDVRPTPDFRHSIQTESGSVAEAIVALAQRLMATGTVSELIAHAGMPSLLESGGLGSDIVLSA
jgi:[lysine-biosynthesis-protein LysW]--L-2-aminoadipate ligase